MCVSAKINLPLLGAQETPGLRQKSFIDFFLRTLIEKTRLLGKIFVPGFVIVYLNTITIFWKLAAVNFANQRLLSLTFGMKSSFLTAFANQRLAFVDFWDDKSSFLISIFFEVRLVTLNLRCYLMVVFWLISPDYATRSLAMHEHLVSVVVTGLISFASLVLRSLAPNLFCSHKTSQSAFVFLPVCDIPLRLIPRNQFLSESIARTNAIFA